MQYVNINRSTTGIPYEAVVFYLICLVLNTYILSRGLSGGVEKVAKFGVPMLLIFGAFLAIRAFTLGDAGASATCTDCNTMLGFNFLWEPQFDSLANPKVWLSAAGQIFFTLSVGMGTIHCYASYVKPKDDIALNAMSAGWMNGFVEIVLGASIVIPIAVGYLGLDWVKENAGFSMAFQTMPYLFDQWGPVLATVSGTMWFGLLFFAGITSSLAMGTPWVGFMKDEFNWNTKQAAWSFGLMVLTIGMPTVLFYQQGVFDEYDYWAGTVSLVVFALAESIIFSWRFGINRGWEELNRGADIDIPVIFKPILKYVTPLIILIVFGSSLVTPKDNDWEAALAGQWELDPGSIVGKIQNKGVLVNRSYFSDEYQTAVAGEVANVRTDNIGRPVVDIMKHTAFYRDANNQAIPIPIDSSPLGDVSTFDSLTVAKTYTFRRTQRAEITVQPGQRVAVGDPIARGDFIHDIFFIDMSRLLLVLLFTGLGVLVYVATVRRAKGGKTA